MNAKRFLYLLFFPLLLWSQQSMAQWITTAEHDALIDLYNSVGGASWTNNTNWNSSVNFGNGNYTTGNLPFGITFGPTGNTAPFSATNPDLKVTGINLPNNNLTGTLPPTFENAFINATDINLAGNNLSGSLPVLDPGIYSNNLQVLNLSSNNFSGFIPGELLNLNELLELRLSNNDLSDLPLPPYNAPNLAILDFSYNANLGGGLPDSLFTSFINAEVFNFSHCKFGGTLPLLTAVTSFSSCEQLRLNNNEINGTIPPAYFTKFPDLQVFDLSNNLHPGPLPNVPVFAYENSIDTFNISNNFILDTMPGSVLQFSNARYIDMSGNTFSNGPMVPGAAINWANLEVLNLRGNARMTDPIPLQAMAASATNLKKIDLYNCGIRDFTGNSASAITTPLDVDVEGNYLEFDDLARLKRVFPTAGQAPADFKYGFQLKATLGGVRRRAPGRTVNWKARVGEPPFNSDRPNRYRWFFTRDSTTTPFDSLGGSFYGPSITILGAISNSVTTNLTALGGSLNATLAPLGLRDVLRTPTIANGVHDGFYYARVTNPDFPDLVIHTETKKLLIGPCTDELGQPVRCQEIFVQFEDGTTNAQKQSVRDTYGAEKIDSCLCGEVELWSLPDTMAVEAFGRGTRSRASSANGEPKIESADPNYDLPTNTNTNSSTPIPPAGSNSSSPVIVAIIDSGVDYDHDDLENYIWLNAGDPAPDDGLDNDNNCVIDDHWGYNFLGDDNIPLDEQGHGTFVAGIVAGLSTPNVDPTVNTDIALLPIKYTDGSGQGTTFDAACAIRYAANQGAKVINASWGYQGESCVTLAKAIEYAGENCGTLFVSSAGNSGSDNDAITHYPSGYPLDNVIAVAALDAAGTNLASYSNFGATRVDLAAVGSNINSTRPYNGTGLKYTLTSQDGTSFAAAQVSRAAALLFAEYPTSSYRAVKDAILGSVAALPAADAAKLKTGGKLDLAAARTRLAGNALRASCDPVINISVNLEGAFDGGTGTMSANLGAGTGGLLPSTQPFNVAPWNYAGTESISPTVAGFTGPQAVTDWVLLGWIDTLDNTSSGEYQAALVQRNGRVISPTGQPISFRSSRSGYLLVMNRNHLAARTVEPFELEFLPSSIDFTDPADVETTYQKVLSGQRVLAAGDSNKDGQVNAVDKNDFWRPQLGDPAGYNNTADYNLDGVVDNDDLNNVWLLNNSLQSGCPECYNP